MAAGEKLTLARANPVTLTKNLSVTIYDVLSQSSDLRGHLHKHRKGSSRDSGVGTTIVTPSTLGAVILHRGALFGLSRVGSYEKRPNLILPLHPGFSQENYLGMNASDYGGGTPIVDVWRKDVGIGVGHVEPPRPKLISLAGFHAQRAWRRRSSVQDRQPRSLELPVRTHTLRPPSLLCTRETTSQPC